MALTRKKEVEALETKVLPALCAVLPEMMQALTVRISAHIASECETCAEHRGKASRNDSL